MKGNISWTLNQMKITNVLDMEQGIYPKWTTMYHILYNQSYYFSDQFL